MKLKRHIAALALVSAGMGLAGCQTGSLGGLALWNKGQPAVASATPDVSKQRFDGLSQQFAGGSSRPAAQALGAPRQESNDNFIVASWKRTSAAVSGALSPKTPDHLAAGESSNRPADDPLRLDTPPKKVGPEVFVGAARLLENQSKFTEAEAQYQKALQTAPNDLNALIGYARLHDRQGNWRDAVSLYQRTIDAHPKSPLAYNDLGLCHARQNQLEASIQALQKAVALQPSNAKYQNNLATVLVEAGRIDEALKQLGTNQSPAVAHYNVGYLLEQRGRNAESQRHYQEALTLDPNLTHARDALVRLGVAATSQPATGHRIGDQVPDARAASGANDWKPGSPLENQTSASKVPASPNVE